MSETPLKVCLVAAEATPLAKTGGLGDVTTALVRYLGARGVDVRLFLPFYGTIDRGAGFVPVEFLQDIPVDLGAHRATFSGWTGVLEGASAEIYLIDCPELFGRQTIYTEDPDEHMRFALFSMAALECCQRMGWSPDVVHCNDWHTALLPLYLRTLYAWDQRFAATSTVLTIHNIGHHGIFPADAIADLGLAGHRDLLDQDELAAGRVNFLSTGVLYADWLTTVSPTHASEIQGDDLGMGLGPLVRRRNDHLIGILNGVDYQDWSPETDRYLTHRYGAKDLDGKERNKRELLEGLSLSYRRDAPALGIVSRLAGQKGIDLLMSVLPPFLASRDIRFVALGSGEARYEEFFTALQSRYPDRVCFYNGFSNELAHRIEAGCDIFLMPSLYEPCGLNQMYSLRYGTPPIVRRTGGLADSVELFDSATGEGTGFVFEHYTAEALSWALDYALATFPDRPLWRRLMRNGMARDFSWESQIEIYLELYRHLRAGALSR